jgi:hypothetical protein
LGLGLGYYLLLTARPSSSSCAVRQWLGGSGSQHRQHAERQQLCRAGQAAVLCGPGSCAVRARQLCCAGQAAVLCGPGSCAVRVRQLCCAGQAAVLCGPGSCAVRVRQLCCAGQAAVLCGSGSCAVRVRQLCCAGQAAVLCGPGSSCAGSSSCAVRQWLGPFGWPLALGDLALGDLALGDLALGDEPGWGPRATRRTPTPPQVTLGVGYTRVHPGYTPGCSLVSLGVGYTRGRGVA